MATAETVERVQKIVDSIGIHGGYITTASALERDLYLLIEGDDLEYVPALMGHFTEFGNATCYDPMFDLVLDIRERKIKSIEIRKYFAQNLMGTTEIYPNGHVYYNGAETGEREDLVEHFGKFIYEAVEMLSYLDKDSIVHKYEKTAYEG